MNITVNNESAKNSKSCSKESLCGEKEGKCCRLFGLDYNSKNHQTKNKGSEIYVVHSNDFRCRTVVGGNSTK